jgi:NADPH:quinone reductase-like Zn-dependent oxidoreductase
MSLPLTGRALEVRGRFGLDALTLTERPLTPPAPRQALVRLSAAALNYRDLMMIEGRYNPKQPLPLIPCSDGVGEVVAAGEGCPHPVGARVLPTFAQGWLDGAPTRHTAQRTLGGPLDGTLAGYALLDADGLVPAPAYLSDPEAATLSCAALTAWSALVELGGLKAGERVLCIGTGGVSVFAAQIAQMMGAEVYLCSRSEGKIAALEARGLRPHHALVARGGARWGREVSRLSGGGVEHVVEVGGAGTLAHSLEAVAPGGVVSLIGVLAGGSAGGADPLNLTSVLMRQVRVQGVLVGHRAGYERMLRAFTLAALRPVIDSTYPVTDADAARAAFAHLASGAHLGKIALDLTPLH